MIDKKEITHFVKELIEINELAWGLRCKVEEVFQSENGFFKKYLHNANEEDVKEILTTIAKEFMIANKNDERFVRYVDADLNIDNFQGLAYELQDIIDEM